MRLLLVLMLLSVLFTKTNAVTVPVTIPVKFASADSMSIAASKSFSAKEIQKRTGGKMNLAARLQWKILQRKLQRIADKERTSKDTLSTIALVTGIVGFLLLFFVPIAGFLLLLTAIITGILGRKNKPNTKSRNRALIGLVLGLAAFGLILIFAIAYSGGF